jgi:outer membrane protein OmpA-like peptidoglycan-associated protein
LRRQIEGMQAKVTDRGLVLTLGDVLFAFDTSTLSAGGSSHLDKLAQFLSKYPQRTAQIDGYTDNIGGSSYNQNLSQRRADAVKTFLVAQGIAPERLGASGMGMSDPVADNASASGRQQNRRVEVVIENRATSVQ